MPRVAEWSGRTSQAAPAPGWRSSEVVAAAGDARRRCKNAGNCLHNEFRLWLGHRRQRPCHPGSEGETKGEEVEDYEGKELSEASTA